MQHAEPRSGAVPAVERSDASEDHLAAVWRALGPLAPCAGFELGSVSASGSGVRTTRTEHVLWKAATLGISAPFRWGRAGVRPEAWIVFPVAMPDFVIDEVGVVHTPRIGVRAALSFELVIF